MAKKNTPGATRNRAKSQRARKSPARSTPSPASGKPLAMAPAYAGAGMGRRAKGWVSAGGGPCSVTFSLGTLRSRVRDLERNDPWISHLATVFASNLVSTGIPPLCMSPDLDFAAEATELWNDWVWEADAEGRTSFYGMQSIAALSMFVSGEALMREINIDDDDLMLPLQYQMLEGDYLDHTYNTMLAGGASRIIQGVEFERYKRAAYHLFRDHPADSLIGTGSMERIRVPADEVLHMFEQRRPGQVRGVPKMSSALLRAMDLAEYEDAELAKKKLCAMIIGFIKKNAPEDGNAAVEAITGAKRNAEGDAFEGELQSGTMQILEPGEDVTFNTTPATDGQYAEYMKTQFRAYAAAGDATYEQTTGDLTGVNFSSIRAGLNEVQRNYQRIQEHIIIPQLCRPVWKRFLQAAIISGQLKPPKDYLENKRAHNRVDFIPPGWPYVNPVQEEEANNMAIRNGTDTRARVAARKGYDVRAIDTEQAQDNARADALALSYDSDGRRPKSAPMLPPPDKKED